MYCSYDRYAIGGLAGGEDKDSFWRVVAQCTAALPEDKPRYVMVKKIVRLVHITMYYSKCLQVLCNLVSTVFHYFYRLHLTSSFF